jgi:hypothetical protein
VYSVALLEIAALAAQVFCEFGGVQNSLSHDVEKE